MVLHDYGVLTQARLNVNIVAIRKQLFVLRSVMKYQPVNATALMISLFPILLWFVIRIDVLCYNCMLLVIGKLIVTDILHVFLTRIC